MNKELVEALNALEKEKEISKETLFEAIENSLITACKNHFGKADNVKVEINRETGDFLCYAEKEVVATAEEVDFAVRYMALTKQEGYVWGAIRTAMGSVSDTCVIQMQDYLNLGGKARMNFPGTLSDSNWTWRAKDGIFSKDLAKKIRELAALYARI